jgi:hypothetical protein
MLATQKHIIKAIAMAHSVQSIEKLLVIALGKHGNVLGHIVDNKL